MRRLLLSMAFLVLAVPLYTAAMARVGGTEPPALRPPDQRADLIHVDKSERRMTLLRNGHVLDSYEISLGADGDGGHKQREGDERTPEGRYVIDWRNDHSIAHLSLHISYPNAADRARARAAGEDPGGFIMIHGIANGWGWLGPLHRLWDWTDGCIAVTDAEMREIWSRVADGTPIEIEA
ncbi:L,D-transpeptidase family protein [Jannaschia aquimarina]|uniref:L,D-transpeptidase catalytic domain n=1 Tax=Jannaschia aquimarina TaxID=935700 RepID=A0A0D1D273_9RHOB|nr:L,D-transpeptidase family protein [Jannaschia aquimarina]KIT14223.1 L,D-transpeptidase catalytic domain [Jannaschia aquimarina]SNS48557.1 L,D-transpeptidase catalytic domain [Jannaschia aquimarina]